MLLLLFRNPPIGLTPRARQTQRIAAGQEHPSADPTMGNGSLFTFADGQWHWGSFAYGPLRWTQDLRQASADGGIFTWNLDMASELRSLGIFTETPQ